MRRERSQVSSGAPGLWLAAAAAVVSGVSVYVNSFGVRHFHQAAVYTTAKNLVALLVLATVALAGGFARPASSTRTGREAPPSRSRGRREPRRWSDVRRLVGLAYVGVVGGGVAFILFFDGLARSQAAPAAFLHDTLVVWVALMALPLLGETLSVWNLMAIALLVGGQAVVAGGLGHLAASPGLLLVLAATLLWSVETVVVRALLAGTRPMWLALVRMGVGVAVLVVYLVGTGEIRQLLDLHAGQLAWAGLTGGLLAGYVAAWMGALSRARAVDVTSILVGAAILTALLEAVGGQSSLGPEGIGLILIGAGTAAAVRGAALRRRPGTMPS